MNPSAAYRQAADSSPFRLRSLHVRWMTSSLPRGLRMFAIQSAGIIGLPPGLSVIDTHAIRESAARPSPNSTSFGRWSGSGIPRVVTNSAP